jgi:hypothetical protein
MICVMYKNYFLAFGTYGRKEDGTLGFGEETWEKEITLKNGRLWEDNSTVDLHEIVLRRGRGVEWYGSG